MQNIIEVFEDSEHRALSLSPENNQIVKSVRLMYYAPNLVMPMHTHSVGQFSTVLSGSCMEENLHSHYENQQGVAEFKPVAYRHQNVVGPNGALFLSVNIDSEHEGFIREFGQIDWNQTELKHATSDWNTLQSILFKYEDAREIDLEEKVLALLNAAFPYAGSVKVAPCWLQLAEQALHDSQMSIEQIAQSVGVHRVHLSRVFQSHFNMSISQYRQRIALQRGICALLSQKENISSASIAAGFSDQSHFTRVLKKQFGVTPLSFTRLFRR